MHGRLKVRTSEEEKIRKDNERAKKVSAYKAGMGVLTKKRSNKEFDEEALTISAQLLSANPDIYTLWNYRRETILVLTSQGNDEVSLKLFDAELQLTEMCLKVNPKSYCSWHQRVWVLNTRPNPDWNKELNLCNVYLTLDERNFHCWDYRRYVVMSSKIKKDKEFNYSTEKIHKNFSNYSAWHYRSKLLTELYPEEDGTRPIEEVHLRDELELVLNAAFTDPTDTSAWFYQRWLLGAVPKHKGFAVCRISPAKSLITFNQSVQNPSLSGDVEVVFNGSPINGEWKSLGSLKHDVVWILDHSDVISSEVFSQLDNNVEVKLCKENGMSVVCKKMSSSNLQLEGKELSEGDDYIGYATTEFKNNFGTSVIEELEKQKESCEQLLELEPNSKWTHLTLAIIKHSIDHIESYSSCNDILTKLMELDPKRENYYSDLYSRWHLEYFLQTSKFETIMSGKFTDKDVGFKKLSTLYHLQYWSTCSEIDLSGHQLTSQSLLKMYVLQNCQILNLSNNCIDTLRGFPVLPKLKTVYLNGNNINPDDVQCIKLKCPNVQNIVFE